VLALVGSNVFEYSGASYVSQSGVPDIGGQPVSGDAYYTYPHLYSILGSYYANTGSPPSAYWGPAGLGEYWKKTLHLTRAGVIYYAQTDSTRGANYIKGWLSNVGVRVDTEQVPLAGDPGPNVLDMQKKGDQAIFDALDLTGNQKVCQAMQNYGFNVPKISTISVWTQQLGQTMSGYPCLNNYYAWGMSSNYADTSNSQVSLFRQAYASFAPGAPISQWSLESWAAGMWFADAASACGNDVTRGCIEKYVNVSSGYAARGLLDTHTTFFPHWSSRPAHISQCYTIVKWAGGGNGTWGTVIDHSANCYTAPTFDYNS
jgi:ABC-type branched-subunit amino acid transport system substrate-binding protein